MCFTKRIIVILILYIALPLGLYAQDTLVTYYDSDWEKIKPKHKSKADHYRCSYINSKGVPVFKCYYMTGELKAEGSYKSKKNKVFDGMFTSYYENGNRSSFGHFDTNNKIGKWLYWFDNGYIMNITNYNMQGEKHGEYKSWYDDSIVDCGGEFLNDKETGEWKYYFQNGKVASLETYDHGELKNFKFWDKLGNRLNTDTREVYEHINFKKGVKGDQYLPHYISSNFVYPPKPRAVGIEGRVMLNFVINEKGELKDLKVTGTKNKLFRAEAERLIKGFKDWIPAKHHNRIISSSYTIPIVFKLR